MYSSTYESEKYKIYSNDPTPIFSEYSEKYDVEDIEEQIIKNYGGRDQFYGHEFNNDDFNLKKQLTDLKKQVNDLQLDISGLSKLVYIVFGIIIWASLMGFGLLLGHK